MGPGFLRYISTDSTYISAQDQIIDDAHDPTHRRSRPAFIVPGVGKVDGLAIAQEAPRKELVVYIQRCCAKIL